MRAFFGRFWPFSSILTTFERKSQRIFLGLEEYIAQRVMTWCGAAKVVWSGMPVRSVLWVGKTAFAILVQLLLSCEIHSVSQLTCIWLLDNSGNQYLYLHMAHFQLYKLNPFCFDSFWISCCLSPFGRESIIFFCLLVGHFNNKQKIKVMTIFIIFLKSLVETNCLHIKLII